MESIDTEKCTWNDGLRGWAPSLEDGVARVNHLPLHEKEVWKCTAYDDECIKNGVMLAIERSTNGKKEPLGAGPALLFPHILASAVLATMISPHDDVLNQKLHTDQVALYSMVLWKSILALWESVWKGSKVFRSGWRRGSACRVIDVIEFSF